MKFLYPIFAEKVMERRLIKPRQFPWMGYWPR